VRKSLETRLNSACVHINRALRRESEPVGLAAEHRSALGVVYFAGPMRMGRLAATEIVGAPAMTRTVAILEAAGLVRRARDPNDDRATLITVTPKGSRLVTEGRDERVRRIGQALGRLSPDARARLARAVGDLEDLVRLL